ncbi:2-keto-4-pentenoate hydratase/2-oxohepta-3-ene-1,7-dioic acid hydratase (catechol pathway) [Halanaeroarchaeum sp. HSR-CO]|uniref:hypothetical protein n=1 Tax=Halanaeroarchaeum sp. HSR-CO TaxID=2866382 RepID=UPI00217E4315|nr:hypothetical protein [Halanaeroarchaeum sp. HSR-CO]UWG48706.1 2-keto-4-pentenoate hydratase/2-oxohepta-3-ene-1,7-dioic acid hydratase (catechol pathway) [Halanaeroarchaeum sp. HSR-CO]
MTQSCPACGTDVVPFTELSESVRDRLEADPERQRQSVPHRREKHTVCPACEFEIHGCGQPYAIPESVIG